MRPRRPGTEDRSTPLATQAPILAPNHRADLARFSAISRSASTPPKVRNSPSWACQLFQGVVTIVARGVLRLAVVCC